MTRPRQASRRISISKARSEFPAVKANSIWEKCQSPTPFARRSTDLALSSGAFFGDILGVPMNAPFALFLAGAFLFSGGLRAAEIPAPRDNWRMELIAEAPKIKYPSVVVCAP